MIKRSLLAAIIACVMVLTVGFSFAPKASAQTAAASAATVSIEQLQQMVVNLQKMIVQVLQLIAQMHQQPSTAVCGNGKCETGETAITCPQDCGTVSLCAALGQTCPTDTTTNPASLCCAGSSCQQNTTTGSWNCVKTAYPVCGNGKCEIGETAASCLADCNVSTGCVGEGQYVIASKLVGVDSTPVGPQNCCAGLTKYMGGGSEWVQNGVCVKFDHSGMNANYLCVKCGDGICNSAAGENVCNCPADCGSTTCVTEGNKVFAYPGAAECCAGLTEISVYSVCIGPSSTNSSGLSSAPVAMPMTGAVCTKCGNGICGPGENQCNCPQDCGNFTSCAKEDEIFSDANEQCCAGLVRNGMTPISCLPGQTCLSKFICAKPGNQDSQRMSAMRQLVSAQEMYYGSSSSNSYLQCGSNCSANFYPSSIGNYLASTPQDPANVAPYVYTGLDNSAASNSQLYCYYAKLEAGGYYTASQAGNYKRSTPPTTFGECATAN